MNNKVFWEGPRPGVAGCVRWYPANVLVFSLVVSKPPPAIPTTKPLTGAAIIGSDRPYGARRVWRDVLADGIDCGLHRIERPMRMQALRARPRRRGLPKDDGQRSAIAPNTLDRAFHAERPNQLAPASR